MCCAYIHEFTRTHTHTHTHIYIYCAYIFCVYIRIYIYIYIYIYIHMYFIYICTYILCVYIYTYKQTHTHTHTHTLLNYWKLINFLNLISNPIVIKSDKINTSFVVFFCSLNNIFVFFFWVKIQHSFCLSIHLISTSLYHSNLNENIMYINILDSHFNFTLADKNSPTAEYIK